MKTRSLWIFGGGLLFTVLTAALFWRLAVIDDAFITFRYAANVAHGFGPVFNPGERVEGCSAFLHMMMLVPFVWLRWPLEVVSVLLSAILLSAVAAAGHRFIAVRTESSFDRACAYLFPVAVLTNPALWHWMHSGMETILYMALVFAAVWRFHAENETGKGAAGSAALAVLAAMARPEGVFIALALAASTMFRREKTRGRRAIAFLAVFGALYGIYFVWRFSYYGYLFPNTYYAKVGEPSAALYERGLKYVGYGLMAGVFPLAAIVFGAVAWRRGHRLAAWEKIAWLVVAAQTFSAAHAGGDFLPYTRFLAPVWPWFFLLLWSAARKLLDGSRWLEGRWRPWIEGRRAVVPILALNALTMLPFFNELQMFVHGSSARAYEFRARAFAEILPPQAVIGAEAVGAIGYLTGRRIVDLLGLTDKTIAHTNVPTGHGLPGHEKYNVRYVLGRRPDVMALCVEYLPEPGGNVTRSGILWPSRLLRRCFRKSAFACITSSRATRTRTAIFRRSCVRTVSVNPVTKGGSSPMSIDQTVDTRSFLHHTHEELHEFLRRLGEDEARSKQNYFRWLEYPLALSLAEPANGQRILEIGAGYLNVLPLYLASKFGAEVHAVDKEKLPPDAASHIDALRRRCDVPDDALTVRQADASALPYDNERFDRVLCVSTLEHTRMGEDSRIVKEIGRVLKMGGRAVLTFPFNHGEHIETEAWHGEEYAQRHYNEYTARWRVVWPSNLHFVSATVFGEIDPDTGKRYLAMPLDEREKFCRDNAARWDQFWRVYYHVEHEGFISTPRDPERRGAKRGAHRPRP
ncbi:MAG: class I SAM-dependent methyltransferase [Deltaproteobacteria bacterium]|nr:class I SAM-dependent methyltransferase [Deltaproteobacteria bacterium]